MISIADILSGVAGIGMILVILLFFVGLTVQMIEDKNNGVFRSENGKTFSNREEAHCNDITYFKGEARTPSYCSSYLK